MNTIKKIKNFIRDDLVLRLSSQIIILFGLLPIFFCFEWLRTKIFLSYNWQATTGLVYMIYSIYAIPITTIILLVLFIFEYTFEGFRLKFKSLQHPLIKNVIIYFYFLSLLCLYAIPLFMLAIAYNLISF